MLNPYQARVDERAFLNLPGFHGGAYLVAYVEDTSTRRDQPPRGPYPLEPRIILEIADCSEGISLEFEIRSALHRMNSFHKLDTLIAALQAFRAGLADECELYKQRERERQAAATAVRARARFQATAASRQIAALDHLVGQRDAEAGGLAGRVDGAADGDLGRRRERGQASRPVRDGREIGSNRRKPLR